MTEILQSGMALLLAVTLSIDPATYTVTFTPHPENAEVHIVIEGNPSVNPYLVHDAFPIEGDDSRLVVPRRKLPRGSYSIWAGLYRWVGCELTPVDGSGYLAIHVP